MRAAETAGLACQALQLEPEVSEELRGGAFDSLDLTAGRDNTILVGHEPDFSSEIARLTGARVKLRKGGLAIVDGSTLVALLRPKDLAAIAALRLSGQGRRRRAGPGSLPSPAPTEPKPSGDLT